MQPPFVDNNTPYCLFSAGLLPGAGRPKSFYSSQQLIRGKNVLIRKVFPAVAKQWPLFRTVSASEGSESVPDSGAH